MLLDADHLSDEVYNERLKSLSAEAEKLPRLPPQPHLITTDAHSIICGSTVTLDVLFDAQGRITQIGGETDGCALTKTALVILCKSAIGQSTESLQKLAHEMDAFLQNKKDDLSPPFDALLVLKPAREYKARHSSILLPFTAMMRAIALWDNKK